MKRMTVAVCALAFTGWAAVSEAQSTCDFGTAEKKYEEGRFDEVPPLLEPCLDRRDTRENTIAMLSLLARANLYMDDEAKARTRVARILLLNSDYRPEAHDPQRFKELVEEVRKEQQITPVTSVSKTNESLREAPATVVVVTAEDIGRRGYVDLEQLLHDLPGFDISRVNGDIYSLIYQRGYRSITNDRLLLLLDGVPQNDLSSNTVYLSRQYSLTNIDRVEVVYGPASTMYGANAYTGVISIITKDAGAILNNGKQFAVIGQTTGGGYGSQNVDLTMAGADVKRNMSWTVTANLQRSTERDLSGFSDWDYTYSHLDYQSIMSLTSPIRALVFAGRSGPCEPSPYFVCVGDFNNRTEMPRQVLLTPAGIAFVRDQDSRLTLENGLGFHDTARNWSIDGKFRLDKLTLGMTAWRSQEGVASAYQATTVSGASEWTPKFAAFYLKYNYPLETVKLNLSARFEQTSIERASSRFEYLHTYGGGFLDMYSLRPAQSCRSSGDPRPLSCPGSPWVEDVTLGRLSSQLHVELNGTYDSSERVNAVAGLELAKGSIQSELDRTATGPGFLYTDYYNVRPEQIEHTDAALYAQGTYKPWKQPIKFVLAGRLSYNQINNKPGASGFGSLITPRAGVIYTPLNRRLVLKGIYSEAFKDPTDAQKFGIDPFVNEVQSNPLRLERVRNMELSGNWEPSDRLSFDSALYEAHYSDVVALQRTPISVNCRSCLQYRNRDTFRVRGLQTTARYRPGWGEIWGNYTHTKALLVDPKDYDGFPVPILDANAQKAGAVDSVSIADVARNQANLGVELGDESRDGFHVAARAHYVGPRPTGGGTSAAFAFSTFRLVPIPSGSTPRHVTMDATVRYRGLIPRTTLELIANNLFDKQYVDPGVEFGNGALRVPQAGRTLYLRLTYGLPSVSGPQR